MKKVFTIYKKCVKQNMNDRNKIWDFEGSDPDTLKKHFSFKIQGADAKKRWVKTQTLPMEDIREFEKKVLYNESKNNRN